MKCNMIKLLILADDFTGALDAGVQFVGSGAQVIVKNSSYIKEDLLGQEDENIDHADVLVVQTDTRHVTPKAAYERVLQICKRFQKLKEEPPMIYKKTDSALRGNIGAELDAVLDAGGLQRLFFIPAYPRLNRVTRKGSQYIEDVPLHRSSFAKDPINPISCSYVPDIIHESSKTPVFVVPEEQALEKFSPKERGIYVFDATSDERLFQISLWMKQLRMPFAVAGCAGFANHLTNMFTFEHHMKDFVLQEQKLLVVMGSVHPVSVEQVNVAQKTGFSVKCIGDFSGAKTDLEYDPKRADLMELCKIFQRSRGLILTTNPICENRALANNSIEDLCQWSEDASIVSKNLGKIVYGLLECGIVCTLVITGGDTLCGVMAGLQCTRVEPLDEIEDGVVLARILSCFGEICMITKSGGMGSSGIYCNIEKYLQEHREAKEQVI